MRFWHCHKIVQRYVVMMFHRNLKFSFFRKLVQRKSSSLATERPDNFLEKCDKNVALKNTKFRDLARALFVLRISTWERFIKNSEKFYHIGKKFPGKTITNSCLKATFFSQFVAGEDEKSLTAAAGKLLQNGNVKLMLCPPMEDIEGVSDNFEPIARENGDRMLEYLNIADRINKSQTGQSCVIQYKLTCVFPNESMEIISAESITNSIALASTVEEYLQEMDGGNSTSGSGKIQDKNAEAMKLGLKLSAEFFQKANKLNIPVLVDAELKSTYYAMYAITLAAAAKYNVKTNPRTMVHGTYQCYFKDIKDYVTNSMDICDSYNVRFGAKFVRGAYIHTERKLAQAKGLPNPTCETYDKTSENYDAMIELALKSLARKPNSVGLFVASHNLESVQRAVEIIDREKLSREDPNINFGTIYGMCDHIAFALGKQNYNVYKSVPWGDPEELVPYLGRRAAENYTAFQTARNELPLYKEEIRNRLLLRRKK